MRAKRQPNVSDTPAQTPTSEAEPASELAQLLSAARAHLRRRRALGERALHLAPPASSPAAPSAAAGSSSAAASPIARPAAAASPSPSAPPPAPPRVPPPPRAAPSPASVSAPLPPPRQVPAPASTAAAPTIAKPAAAESNASPLRTAEEVQQTAAACGDLASLRAAVARCHACPLAATRTQTVFSDGPDRARILFVGEAPGENEDLSGTPFVGEAGALLTDIIEKGMGLRRSEVAIANVLKCRPPENRDPSAEETRTCTPWLDRQIELLGPEVIVPLGKHASNHLLGVAGSELRSMGSLRERVHERGGRKLVPTYHPAYLLRTPDAKKDCWKDIQLAMGLLGLQPRRKG